MLSVQLNVAGRRCLVVGGGTVGTRRVRALVGAGADVILIDPHPSDELGELSDGSKLGSLNIELRPFRSGDLGDSPKPILLVVAATSDRSVNESIGEEARQLGIAVSRSDEAAAGDVSFPATFGFGPLNVSVGTEASAPALSRWAAEQLESAMPSILGLDREALETLAGLLVEVRSELREGQHGKKNAVTSDLDWRSAFDGSILDSVTEGRRAEAKERLLACLLS